ncbi:NAD(P)/FAD-dependent oxidoreductase [Chitinophaga sp.]|uniref:flavin monoamine oxidase family protein n=1 Tax=Chitinophaga sp. TaxID=1869181 RepID=UPI0031D44008
MKIPERVIIAGGGLSGLLLAYLLRKKGTNYLLLEAAPRLGGRIQTVNGALGTPLELGATWFSEQHPHLCSLVEELALEKFPQFSAGISIFQTKSFEPPQQFFVPESESPSYRLRGGTGQLIKALSDQLDDKKIVLNARIETVEEAHNGIKATTSRGTQYEGSKIVICLPPQLAGTTIQFKPSLPGAIAALLPDVQTWMAGAIKFTLEYPTPFWRNRQFSGMLYSHAGIVVEMYDHTNFEENRFGFTGFLNSGASAYHQDVRKELVLGQLTGLFGEEAGNPSAYFDKVWTDEYLQAGAPSFSYPHQHNGHELLQRSYYNNKLFFCGTETSTQCGGYMEGAVTAVKRWAAAQL